MSVSQSQATDWPALLLQGTGAAVIGLTSAVLVFWLTRRHHEKRDAARRAAEAEERISQSVTDAVADLSSAASFLVRDLTTAPFFRVEAITELLAATLRFVMVTRPTHPDVANWAMLQFRSLSAKHATYRSQWLVPWGRARRLHGWSDHAGQLAGKVLEWHLGEVPEAWFTEQLALQDEEGSPLPVGR